MQVLLLSHGKTAFRDSKRILATTRSCSTYFNSNKGAFLIKHF